MMDVDAAITAELERMFPVSATPDWEAIVAAAGLGRRRRTAPFVLVLAAALVAIAFATPLGATIVHGLGGFSDWLSGEPGKPASQREQASFAKANAHSWLGFPKDTRLRHLSETKAAEDIVDLAGFRAGSSYCLRLAVTGADRTSHNSCAPLADLRRRDAPVRVLFADQTVGRGDKTEWRGIDRMHSAKLQITAGIVADGVGSVVLVDDRGRHVVPVVSDSFLYVAAQPEIGQRVTKVSAHTATGLVAVPFVPAPFGPTFGGSRPKAPAVTVTAPVRNGRIGWLERREPRGQPLSTLPARWRRTLVGAHRRTIVFGRVLTPAAGRPVRMVLTLNGHHRGGPVAGLCTMLFETGAGGGGCMPYPQVFARSPIVVAGYTGSGGGQFTDVSGVLADGVARLRAKLANGQWVDVPFADSTFAVELPVGHLPAVLVTYDAKGQTTGVSDPIDSPFGGPSIAPAPGRAKQILAVKGPNGQHAELLVGAGTNGATCEYVKAYMSKHANGVMEDCHPAGWSGSPLQLGTNGPFVEGRVRPDVARVRVAFLDGSNTTVEPVKGGYVLAIVSPADRLQSLVSFTALDKAGRTLGVERIRR
jgi:hypothetical protein